MKHLTPAVLLLTAAAAPTACTVGGETREPVAIEFREEATEWVLTPEGAETLVAMKVGDARLEFGKVPGSCAPAAQLPFTEVQGQPALAALACDSPDGGKHDVVLVLVPSEDPSWPAPVGLAMVVARTTAADTVALMTMGMQELPLGVTPRAPVVTQEEPSSTAGEEGDSDAARSP